MYTKKPQDQRPDVGTSEEDTPSSIRGIIFVVAVVAAACVAATVLLAHEFGSPPPQIQSMLVSPDTLDFGNVRKDGIIDALIVLEQPSSPNNAQALQINQAAHIMLSSQGYLPSTLKSSHFVARCQYRVRADTSEAGRFVSTIAISWGGEEINVPVRYTVQNEIRDHRRVFITETPFNGHSVSDARVLDALRSLVARAELDVEYHDSTQDNGSTFSSLDLTPYAAILLAGESLNHLADPLVEQKLSAYLNRGGRLILAANAYQGGSVQNVNRILTNFGLEMQYKEVAKSEVSIPGSDTPSPELTGVSTLRFHRPSPILITDPRIARIVVAAPEFPALAYVALADVGEGEIIAIGQSQWWSWIGGEGMADCDNARLLQNVLID